MKVTRTSDHAGMSLLEMLGYVAVLGVVINLAASVFVNSSRLSALCTAALDRVAAVEEIRDEFTASVRESYRIRTSVGRYRTGTDYVVLDMARVPEDESTRRYVVFGPIESESRLSKLVIIDQGGTLSAEMFVTYRQELDSIQFSYDSDDVGTARLVTIEIEPKDIVGRGNKPPPHTFAAAMRGVATRGWEDGL